jgi:hypothetical protein
MFRAIYQWDVRTLEIQMKRSAFLNGYSPEDRQKIESYISDDFKTLNVSQSEKSENEIKEILKIIGTNPTIGKSILSMDFSHNSLTKLDANIFADLLNLDFGHPRKNFSLMRKQNFKIF